jgi:hypothetical protein
MQEPSLRLPSTGWGFRIGELAWRKRPKTAKLSQVSKQKAKVEVLKIPSPGTL